MTSTRSSPRSSSSGSARPSSISALRCRMGVRSGAWRRSMPRWCRCRRAIQLVAFYLASREATMRGLSLVVIVVSSLAVSLSPRPSEAQRRTSRTLLLAGLTVGGARTPHPEGGIATAGIVLGIERSLTTAFSLRALASPTRGVFSADDIALCHPEGGGCLPDAVFPTWMSGLAVEGSLAPRGGLPIRLVGGLGATLASAPRENQRTRGIVDESAVVRATWRAGLELPLGSSSKAPFVQLTRTGFGVRAFSVSSVDAVTVSFRR